MAAFTATSSIRFGYDRDKSLKRTLMVETKTLIFAKIKQNIFAHKNV